MDDRKQLTVDSLKKILEEVSANGFGDMPIFLGKDTPLMDDAIGYRLYIDSRMTLHHPYYDEQMVDAAARFKNDIEVAIKKYISGCYKVNGDL